MVRAQLAWRPGRARSRLRRRGRRDGAAAAVRRVASIRTGARPAADNAFKLPLAERTLAAALHAARG